MISPFITAVPLRIPARCAVVRITSTTTAENPTTSIHSVSSSLPKSPPQAVSINERLQSFQNCKSLEIKCPTHGYYSTLVCTDIICEHEYRVGCVECLHTSHHGHMIISLDKFFEILKDIQIKESDKSMLELRDQINDMKEELQCTMNNYEQKRDCEQSIILQKNLDKINKSLKLLDQLTRLKKSDLIPLQRERINELALNHYLFSQNTQKVFHCVNLFAEIAYTQHFDELAWETMLSGRIEKEEKDNDNIDEQKQIQECIVRKSGSRKGRLSLKNSFIFTQNLSKSNNHKNIWKITQEKIKVQENQQQQSEAEGVKIQSQDKQIEQDCDDNDDEELIVENLTKKMKIADRKTCISEEDKKTRDQDMSLLEEMNGKKKRKLNDNTGIDIVDRLENESKETKKTGDTKEQVTNKCDDSLRLSKKLRKNKQKEQILNQVNKKEEKDDWLDDSEISDSLDFFDDEDDDEISELDLSDDQMMGSNSDKIKSKQLESLLMSEKQQNPGTHLEEQEISEIDEEEADNDEDDDDDDDEDEEDQISKFQTIIICNNNNNNNQLSDLSNNIVKVSLDGIKPQSKIQYLTNEMKSQYSSLRDLLLNEFQRLFRYSDNISSKNKNKCLLKYKYIGPKQELSIDSNDFEEYIQELNDSIVIDQHQLLKESRDFINWISNKFLQNISRSYNQSPLIFSKSRQVAHTTDWNIRKKILSMTFINNNVFLTIGQNSEIKLWSIDQSNKIILPLQKTNLDVSTIPNKVIVSTNARNFLLSGELYNDKGCSLFGMNFQTNKTQFLRHYRAKNGPVDTPFTGLLLMDKFIVIQKRNQFTRVGLFVPETKKYIKNYTFQFTYDNISLVARSKSLLALSSSSSSRIGVLDLISGRDEFLNLQTAGDYYIFAGQGFQNLKGEIFYAVSLTLNTDDSPFDQVATSVPKTEQRYSEEQIFRFEIYKLTQKGENPTWEKIYMKSSDNQVIQFQYCPLLDELIILEGFSSKNYPNMSQYGSEDELEMKVDANSKGYEISTFNIEKKTAQTLLKQVKH